MKKNVLITGAAGFLGSHLALRHLRAGDTVLGVDNFCSSERESPHVLLTKELYGPMQYVLSEVDISEGNQLWLAVEDFLSIAPGKIDLVYNFACPASPPRYQSIPVETLLTCTAGTNNVLSVARAHGATVVHASTSEVYGDPEGSPQLESYRGNVNSYGPRSCYDEGKRAAEALCYDYLHKYDTDVRVVRIFNTYGPHMDAYDGRVVTNFIRQALKGEKFTIYGSGQQSRSFCYVDDLIDGVTELARLPNNPRTPINIGNPNEFSMLELARVVSDYVHGEGQRHSWLEYMPLPVDDPKQRCPDITQARQRLGFKINVQLREGIARTTEYFRSIDLK